ncbi:MAG: DUF6452 family protein [Bacteroidales bacterium]|nr:DUF6452 family protein [Bacteroidales bacterium]MDT8374584.1 DUF6452 family protein [Bacteroidales bacterium]
MRCIPQISAYVIASVMAFLISSCSVQPCYEDTDPLMNTVLLASGTGESITADSLRVRGVSLTDTVEFVDARSVTSFSVPLDPSSDLSLFYITVNGIHDTAAIYYTRQPHLVSPECGYTFLSIITGVTTTHNIIDTLIIENSKADLNGEKNLHLFF